MVISGFIKTFQACKTLDGIVIECILEIQCPQQFQDMSITGNARQGHTIGQVEPLVVHHRNKLAPT